jgi:hypothetical protein
MMKRSLALFASLVVASLVSVACGFQHQTSVLSPTAPTNSSSAPGPNPTPGVTTPSLVGAWSSNPLPTLPSANSCGNFQYQIASQTATSIAGTFTAACGAGVTVSASLTGQLNGSAVLINGTGKASAPGIPDCSFTLTGNGTIEDNGYTLRVLFSGTTCFGPVSGTEVLRRPQPAAEPPPPPPPTPQPAPAPAPAPSVDAIDLHQVVVTGGNALDVANWPVTTRIRVLDFRGDGLFVDFDKKEGAGRWPDVTPPGWDGPIQYTMWMVVNHGGRWYTSGGVEYWHGLSRQGGPPSQYAANWYYSPQVWGVLASHQPAVGEQVGFFVTAGDQRVKDVRAVTERSNVVMVSFPSDAGGYYPF